MSTPREDTAGALQALHRLLGDERLRRDPGSRAAYGVDRTTRWQPDPCAVALPETTAEVQEIVRIARRHRLPLVPSGGRTGLSGGAVARRGELVVAMERMRRVLGFDATERSLSVEAGVTTAAVQEYAAARQLYYPVDFASSGSSQIGGNIATNAGGIRVIRHGMTRDQVTGLTVVDGRGEVLELNRGLIKNNTGPDFRHLFIGSEGILGIITAVTLRLQAPPPPSEVLLLAVRDFPALLQVLAVYHAAVHLSAFEFFADNALGHVVAAGRGRVPFATRTPFYALLEYDAGTAQAQACYERCVEAGWVADGVLAQSLAQARSLWRLREDISETLAPRTPWKSDIAVRLPRMGVFITEVEESIRAYCAELEVVWYGHIGDGNLHLNVLKPPEMEAEAFAARCAALGEQLAARVQDHGGSISAEHGVGLLKKPWLGSSRSRAEIVLLGELKRVFDPDGILNPGKLLDP